MSDNADESATESAEDAVAGMAAENNEATGGDLTERPENVPEKFWDSENSVVKHDDVLKSYTELEGRFGSFTGAPDEYAVGISDELKEAGVDLDSDDPMVEEAIKFAKESGMNQDGFNNMVNLYATMELAKHKAESDAMTEDIASLGDNADRRLNNLSQWASKNLPDDLLEGFKDAAVSADSVKALEQLVSMTRSAPVQVNDAQSSPGVSREEVHKMQFEKDEHGNRRIATDPAFAAEFRKKQSALYGDEDHRVVVG